MHHSLWNATDPPVATQTNKTGQDVLQAEWRPDITVMFLWFLTNLQICKASYVALCMIGPLLLSRTDNRQSPHLTTLLVAIATRAAQKNR